MASADVRLARSFHHSRYWFRAQFNYHTSPKVR